MDSIAPLPNGKQMQHGEEVLAELFESSCQSPHIFHFAEEPFDDIAHSVKIRVMRDRGFGVGFRGNHRQSALIGDLLADGFAAVGFVGSNGEGGVQSCLK